MTLNKINNNKYAIEIAGLNKSFYKKRDFFSVIYRALNLFLTGSNKIKLISNNNTTIFRNINLLIPKGTIIGILGPNGSGKTTLLKIISGISFIDSFEKFKINGTVANMTNLGDVLIKDLSGRENINLSYSLMGKSNICKSEYIKNVLKFSELGDQIDNKVKTYSSGMISRLSFSISIFSNADIFLIDEVLSVGDDYFKNKCLQEIIKLKELSKTFLFVSHNIDQIRKFSDSVFVLNNKKINFFENTNKGIKFYQNLLFNKKNQKNLLGPLYDYGVIKNISPNVDIKKRKITISYKVNKDLKNFRVSIIFYHNNQNVAFIESNLIKSLYEGDYSIDFYIDKDFIIYDDFVTVVSFTSSFTSLYRGTLTKINFKEKNIKPFIGKIKCNYKNIKM